MTNRTAWAAALALAVFSARAEDPPKTEEPPKEEVKYAASGQEKQVEKLSAEFGVEKDEVRSLREKGLGWGEVRHALAISRKSGKPVADILKLREGGMGWGEIAKKEGVRLGPDRAGKGAERAPKTDRGGGGGRERGGKGHGRGPK
jgi:hypothetical protein